MTLLQAYLRLLLRLCFDKKRHGQRIGPWGRRLIAVLPKPTVRWSHGRLVRPHYMSRAWVVSAVHRTHEPGLERLIDKAVRPGDTVLDVGAQVGLVTVVLAQKVGPSGRVYALEPDPYNLTILREVLTLNGLDNVVLVAKAAGSREGTAAFAELTPAGYSLVPDHLKDAPGRPPRPVEVVRLDRFVEREGLGGVDFVKIDVDGPDYEVLRGAEGLLRAAAPPLVTFEVSRYWQWFGVRFDDARFFLAQCGYSLLLGRRKEGTWERLGPDAVLPEGWGERKGLAINVVGYRPDVHDDRLAGLL